MSFLINNRWCCESAISKPACIGRASHCMKSCESCVLSNLGAGGELKLPAPPTQPKDRLHVFEGIWTELLLGQEPRLYVMDVGQGT